METSLSFLICNSTWSSFSIDGSSNLPELAPILDVGVKDASNETELQEKLR
jgi:hypothetical protein